MTIGIAAITDGGWRLARRLAAALPAGRLLAAENRGIAELLAENWRHHDGLILIMAAGVAVRAIAPLLTDKRNDPAVVVMDERGRHAISLVSGHLGGGNALARRVAAICGGEAVITTASDTLGLAALDLWAKKQRLVPESSKRLTKVSALLVNRGTVTLYSEIPVEFLPAGLVQVDKMGQADIIVSNRLIDSEALLLRPRNVVVGVGCNRGATMVELDQALTEILDESHLSRLAVRNLASIEQKRDEDGLIELARNNHWPVDFFTSAALNAKAASLDNSQLALAFSPAAMRAVGASHGVAEPAALISAASNHLLCGKRKWNNVTLAIAQASCTLSASDLEQSSI